MPDSAHKIARPETQVLLLVSRTALSPEAAGCLRELLSGEIDWAGLVARSGDHGLFPLLYNHLNSSAADFVPAAWLEFLRDLFRQNARRSLLLTAELIRVITQLENVGITAVPYKGPVLASIAYNNLGLRYFQDLDILVRQSDILRAQQVFHSLGYEAITGAAPADIAAGRVPGQYAYARTREKILLEVHTEHTLRYFAGPPDFDRLWKRLDTIDLGGKPIPTLSSSDLFSFLSIHGTKHLWARLSWICDVAELARKQDPSDWPLIREQATSYGAQRMVALALLLARDMLDAPLPQQVAAWIEGDAVATALAEGLRARIMADNPQWPGAAGRFWFRVRVRPRLEEGIRYALRLTMTPTQEDWGDTGDAGALAQVRSAARRLLRLVNKYGLGRRGMTAEGALAGSEPTSAEFAEKLLEFAEVHPGDVLYDLSSGDGRIVIEAAKRYAIRAVGVDTDPERIAAARRFARQESVAHLVAFRREDAGMVDLSEATVVTLHFPWAANLRLRDTLRRKLRPGTRVISRNAGMGDWSPDKTEVVANSAGTPTTLFLWHVPQPDRSR